MKKLFLFSLFIFNSLLSQIDFGQRFILALPNSESKAYLKSWLQKTRPAGVMLQTFHFKDCNKTKQLVTFLQEEAKSLGMPELFVSVDWEGGIVSRPNEAGGFVSVPSPKNLAFAGRTYCFLAGKLIGQQLRSVGININFAPSLDLFDIENFVLGSRTFSSNSYNTFKFAQAFANGLKSEGIIPVFKHFPGLGLGNADTHLDKVNIRFTKKQFANHVYPFVKTLKKEQNPFVMVGHAKYPSIFGNKPATLSEKVSKWIKKRNKNVFLVTDDFAMKAVRGKKSLDDIVLNSLDANFDLIIFSAKPGEDVKLISDLGKRIDDLEDVALQKIKFGIKRIKNFKKDNLNSFNKTLKINIFSDLLYKKSLGKILAQKSIKEFYSSINLKNKDNILISVDLPKIRPNEKWFVNNNSSCLKQKLEKSGVKLDEFIFNPKDYKSVKDIRAKIQNNSFKGQNLIVQTFFYGTGDHNKYQKRLLEDLKDIQNNLIVISLGHPYEENILPEAKIFNLGSFSKPMLKEVTKRLVKNKVPNKDFSVKRLLSKLKNKKFGLLCHNASRVKIGNKEIFMPDFLFNFSKKQNNNTELVSLFSPEHGLNGTEGATVNISSEKTSKWECPVYSLHGKYKKPTKDMLKGLDLLVIDLHEVGIRPFTYLSSLDLALQSAKENDLSVLVIDHVNPVYFWNEQGPVLKEGFKSFVGRVNVPFIHGKTIGSIAKDINKDIGANLTVLPSFPKKLTKKFLRYNDFVAPSPNLATLESVYSYPVTVFVEGTNYSEGRGTNYPFQQIGAPWVDGKKLASILNSKKLPGVYFESVSFKPVSLVGKSVDPKHKNKKCYGVFLHFYDLKNAKPMNTAQAILKTLFEFYPKKLKLVKYSGKYFLDNLVGNDSWRKGLIAN